MHRHEKYFRNTLNFHQVLVDSMVPTYLHVYLNGDQEPIREFHNLLKRLLLLHMRTHQEIPSNCIMVYF